MHQHTRIEATLDSPTDAAVLLTSLAPEAVDLVDERSRTSLSRSGATVRIDIEATDLTALRAAINTWSGLLGVAEAVASLGESASRRGQ